MMQESGGSSAERIDDASAAPAAGAQSRHRVDRARLARIFGDALPDTTRDERDASGEREGGTGGSDEWLRGQVPPHHG